VSDIKFEFSVEFGSFTRDLQAIVDKLASRSLKRVGELLVSRIVERLGHAGSGVWYKSHRRDGSRHQASAPGEPPAPDTRRYQESWGYRLNKFRGLYSVEIGSDLWLEYGRRLELGGHGGGAYIAPRPHVRPVFAESEDEVQGMLEDLQGDVG
jgi:hypothetical protein